MGIPWWGWTLISFGAFWSLAVAFFVWNVISAVRQDMCD
jgi:hypothetical protein